MGWARREGLNILQWAQLGSLKPFLTRSFWDNTVGSTLILTQPALSDLWCGMGGNGAVRRCRLERWGYGQWRGVANPRHPGTISYHTTTLFVWMSLHCYHYLMQSIHIYHIYSFTLFLNLDLFIITKSTEKILCVLPLCFFFCAAGSTPSQLCKLFSHSSLNTFLLSYIILFVRFVAANRVIKKLQYF